MVSSQHLPKTEPAADLPAPDAAAPPVADDATVISQRQPGSVGGAGLPSPRGRPPHELGKLLSGERLNHFELLEYVGGGGMGTVFRARDTMLGREVALKVLSRDQGADDETRRRFQNEAQSAARLDHENIARVYFVGEDRGLNYIVFEFIEGVNLRDLVERNGGPLPLSEALSYTMQIARALEHAASRDVVHRDIKPSNVLITAEGRAKLVDMGLARLHQVNAGADLTASGVTLGTFDYISPEQARDPRVADVRSDIYSLGCTLYYMLTARPPFPEGTVLQKLLQHNSDDPPDPREFNAALPAQVSDVVRRMLAKNPRRRYQAPAELIADLLTLAEATGLSPGLWRLADALPRPPGEDVSFLARHLPWLVPVGLLVAAVVALDLLSSHLPSDRGGRTQASANSSEGGRAARNVASRAPGQTRSAAKSGNATASGNRLAETAASGQQGSSKQASAKQSGTQKNPRTGKVRDSAPALAAGAGSAAPGSASAAAPPPSTPPAT
ncbi:MAG TPA: serine/threonine-protein kinase, partial [Pirellulales bacterium]|nr:serine/threonine-protein kinase [Pirellulales bacterium]